MIHIHRSWQRTFPSHAPGILYSVAADIESYPSFVPGCLAARILTREGAVWQVENTFGFGLARIVFVTEARVEPPLRLSISANDAPWGTLSVAWRFAPEARGSSAECRTDLGFRSRLTAGIVAATIGSVEEAIIAAFEARVVGNKFRRDGSGESCGG